MNNANKRFLLSAGRETAGLVRKQGNLQFPNSTLTEWIFSLFFYFWRNKLVGWKTNGCFLLTFPFKINCVLRLQLNSCGGIFHKLPAGWNVTEHLGWWILIVSNDPTAAPSAGSRSHHPSSASPWRRTGSSSDLSRTAARWRDRLLRGFFLKDFSFFLRSWKNAA